MGNEEIPQDAIDIGVKFALAALARSALEQLVIARGGAGGWLDQLEQDIVVHIRNSKLPGVADAHEPPIIDDAVAVVRGLIAEARGDAIFLD